MKCGKTCLRRFMLPVPVTRPIAAFRNQLKTLRGIRWTWCGGENRNTEWKTNIILRVGAAAPEGEEIYYCKFQLSRSRHHNKSSILYPRVNLVSPARIYTPLRLTLFLWRRDALQDSVHVHQCDKTQPRRRTGEKRPTPETEIHFVDFKIQFQMYRHICG